MTGNNNTGIQKLQCFSLAFYAVKKNYDIDTCRKKWFDDYDTSKWQEFEMYYELLNHTKFTLQLLNENNKQLNIAMQKNIRNNMLNTNKIQVTIITKTLEQVNSAIKILHQLIVEYAIIATGILSDDRVMFEIDNRYHLTYTGISQDLATALQYTLKGYGLDLYKVSKANEKDYGQVLHNYLQNTSKVLLDKALENSYNFCLEDLYKSEKLDKHTYEQYKHIQYQKLLVTAMELSNLHNQTQENEQLISEYKNKLAQLEVQNKEAADFTLAVITNLL